MIGIPGGSSRRRIGRPGPTTVPSAASPRTLRTRSSAQAALLVGDPHALMAADLVTAGCPVDGRQHFLDERAFAAELLAYARGAVHEPWLGALCGRRLLPDSLLVGPRPICPACVHAAVPRLRAAGRDVTTVHGQRLRAVLDRVASIGLHRRGTDDVPHGHGNRPGDRGVEGGRG